MHLGQNQIGGQTYGDWKLGFHILLENVPGDEKGRHKQQKKGLLQTKGILVARNMDVRF